MATTSIGSKITEAAVAAVRARIGQERPAPDVFNDEATRSAIRHFAHGIGDTNPLWLDDEYAAQSRFGGIIAPPSFLFTCGLGRSQGLPGVHGMFAGVDFEFLAPVRLGDRVRGWNSVHDLVEKQGQFAGRQFLQTVLTVYRDQDETVVGRCFTHVMRTERETAGKKGKYLSIERQRYTAEQLAEIDAAYEAEVVRGASPRHWEDVQLDEALPQIVKGPLTVTDMLAFLMGFGSPFVRAHKVNYAYRKRHPAAYIPNDYGIPDVPERVHWEDDFARRVGVPGAYDYGWQRIAWLSNLVTNWQGDAGWLKQLSVQLRRFNVVGDTTWCRGKVVNKRVEDGEHVVDLELWCENQRGEITAPGSATVVLPSRG
ncbi:MAG: MaoC family dehydratase N-terminal domain-containing protein [Chloroflexi bacterium]|nr:MaoC family dehydratase N-terminal domain-containing protein [Chloroflexota bacterium]